MLVVRILVGLVGVAVVTAAIVGAVTTVVLPRGVVSRSTRAVFLTLRRFVFSPLASPRRSFEFRDRVMAFYAPIGLLALPVVWIIAVICGYTAIFWSTGVRPLAEAFTTSGSSVLTLGYVRPAGVGRVAISFSEALIGLGLVSLMISYLPSIYGAFSRREALVGMLEVRAGLPPSPAELLTRYSRIGRLAGLDDDLFVPWEGWFADVEESHTSQPSLAFFRSPHPERNWVTAAGCVLDTAAVATSLLDRPRDARADLTLRAGFLCLRRISDYFGLPYDPDPKPTEPISISRREFDLLCVELEAAGVRLKADRDQAWRDFAGWRVNYDAVLIALCRMVMAPPAKWSSDRPAAQIPARVRFRANPRADR